MPSRVHTWEALRQPNKLQVHGWGAPPTAFIGLLQSVPALGPPEAEIVNRFPAKLTDAFLFPEQVKGSCPTFILH